jgi:putative transposase
MQSFEQLEYSHFYHVYNHGVDELDLFRTPDNSEYFLGLYDKYISPVADTFAGVLMPNHFHLLVRIKELTEVAAALNLTGFRNLSGLKPLHQHFSNLFNTYTKAFNKYHESRCALFERPFNRKLIDNDRYLKRVILYIHNNPVHHGFCSHPLEYAWSSYHTCTSAKPTKLKRGSVIGWFNNQEGF